MNRTGSMGSRVPPAETTIRNPARSRMVGPPLLPACTPFAAPGTPFARDPGRPRASSASRARATITGGSAMRPDPTSPPASRPFAGSTTPTPRDRSTARLCCTAGCSHISVCMAGHTTHRGHRGQQRGRQEVIGHAGGVAGQQIRGSRCHHDQIGVLAEAGVGNGRQLVPQIDLSRLGTESVEGGPAHKPGGPLGQDRRHMDSGVDQTTADLDGLVGGDPGRHAEHHERLVARGLPTSRPRPSPPLPGRRPAS